jgi:hypothetical protein
VHGLGDLRGNLLENQGSKTVMEIMYDIFLVAVRKLQYFLLENDSRMSLPKFYVAPCPGSISLVPPVLFLRTLELTLFIPF